MICHLSLRARLTPIEHGVQFSRIWRVVDHSTVYFDPRVCLEWHLLGTDYHLSGHAVAFQQTRRGSRSLKAENLFPIPNARHIHCCADLFDCAWTLQWPVDWKIADLVVQGREVSSRQVKLEMDQFQIRLQCKKRHGGDAPLFHTGNCNWSHKNAIRSVNASTRSLKGSTGEWPRCRL